jgi:hypothetical protein
MTSMNDEVLFAIIQDHAAWYERHQEVKKMPASVRKSIVAKHCKTQRCKVAANRKLQEIAHWGER